jgi:hypothetical protein
MSRTPNHRLLTRVLWTIPVLAIVILALGAATPAQGPLGPPPLHFAGLVNDYTPSNVTGGPYEMRGTWSLDIFHDYANFSVTMNMETSDYGVTTGSIKDPTMPPDRGAHTHLISLTHASLSTDTSHCPTYSPATTGPVIVVTGQPQILTGNGGPAPFQLKGPSTLWVCLAGGTQLPYSNLAFTFTDGPATGHFGSYAIHGVVLPPKDDEHGPAMQ